MGFKLSRRWRSGRIDVDQRSMTGRKTEYHFSSIMESGNVDRAGHHRAPLEIADLEIGRTSKSHGP
jgi:hypothetical protein